MMLLAIDVGNTNIKMGLFSGGRLINSWRLATDRSKTGDEYGVALQALLMSAGLKRGDIDGVIMSSVVPGINFTLEHMLAHYLDKTPMLVGPGIRTGLNIKLDNPRELGGDIICDCVSAFRRYGGPCIVLDFGTATTISAVSGQGEFLGGAICPGVKLALDALAGKAAKLPNIELELPQKAIGRNTVASMQSGLLYGYVGQVEYLISRFKQEMAQPDIKVIATGGMSRVIGNATKAIDTADSLLTLEGLRLIYEMNS